MEIPVIRFRTLILIVPALILAACGTPATSSTGASQPAPATTNVAAPTAPTVGAAGTAGPQALQQLEVGLGYIPNVQFAPFYVAAAKGYYAAEGLDVKFSYGGNVNDMLIQTASGKLPFVLASGDEILLARTQGVPVQMVFLLYQKFPVAVFSKKTA